MLEALLEGSLKLLHSLCAAGTTLDSSVTTLSAAGQQVAQIVSLNAHQEKEL